MANNLIDIENLKEQAISKIRSQHKIKQSRKLDLIDINIYKQEHKLSSTYLQLIIGDLDSRKKGKYSENAYDTYTVRINIDTGEVKEIIKSGLETFKQIDDEVLR